MPILPLLMDPTLTNVDPTLALPTLCFALLDSEEPCEGSIPDRGKVLVNPKTVN